MAAQHIVYEESGRVFKLTAGSSMYAMRVSESGGLEHLYWGPALPSGADLQYLTRSNVAQPFDPTVSRRDVAVNEAEPQPLGDVMAPAPTDPLAEALSQRSDALTTWKAHRGAADGEQMMKASHADHAMIADSVYERRLENISWRILGMQKKDADLTQVATRVMGTSQNIVGPAKATQASRANTGSIRRAGSSFVSLPKAVAPPRASGKATSHALSQAFSALDLTVNDVRLRSLASRSGTNLPNLRRPRRPSSEQLLPSSSKASMASARNSGHGGEGVGSASHSSSLEGVLGAMIDLEEEEEEGISGGLAPRPHHPCAIDQLLVDQPTMEVGERVGKNMSLLEVSDMGTGDYRQPSFIFEYTLDGSTISPLTYVSHAILPGKAPMPSPMPHIRPHAAPPAPPGAPPTAPPADGAGGTEEGGDRAPEASTLVVTLEDRYTGLVVEAHFTAMHNFEAIVRRLIVRNTTRQVVRIKRAMSATVDFDVPLHNYWLTQLDGSWARERHVTCRRLDQGVTSFGSQRGTSSHQHSPFFAISEGHSPPEEDSGTVYGFALVYSGSFLAEAEVVDVGRLRVNLGLQAQGFTWHLEPGGDFTTPECVCVFSPSGLGRMSRQFHGLVREHLIPPGWRHVPCPVLCNTWEAEYFNVSHDSVVAMARAARAVGVEMIVLDDGWFGERHDATSSLGDWAPNVGKFPFGIRGLVHEVNAEGLQFGIWIEPEMISTNSELYAAHPDWCLQVPGRTRHEGRNQLVLDLTREEVREHIFESIAVTLRGANICYVKWDMNRHLTEAFSVALPRDRQGEVLHRYTLGVYALHHRFVTAFPNVRFEACSGGGGRFDLGILFFCPQVWASDNTDALMRMKIQHGTSYLFPALTVGSHYSITPNHITQGYARKRTRALVAMCGTFGYELDLRRCGDSADALRRQVAAHKLVAPIVRDGDLYRLWDPFRVSFCAWAYVLRTKQPDGTTAAAAAAVFAFNRSSTFWSNLVPRLQLRGLDPDALYDVREPLPNNRTQKSGTLEVIRTPSPVYQLGAACVRMDGATLMHAGIPVRFLTQDDSLLFLLKRVPARDGARRGY